MTVFDMSDISNLQPCLSIGLLAVHVVAQVVAAANDNPYGLAAGVLAKDQRLIDGLVRRLTAGTVWVNTYNVYDAGEGASSCLSCIVQNCGGLQQPVTTIWRLTLLAASSKVHCKWICNK